MLDLVVQIYRAAAPTSLTTLYTNTAGTKTVVTSAVVTNNSDAVQTYSLLFGGIEFAGAVSIPPRTSHVFDIRQVLTGTQAISGFASATTVKFHLAGVTG